MADQMINGLPVKTTTQAGDKALISGVAEEYLIDIDKLADIVLNKLTNKAFALDQGTMTLLAALNALNSNTYNKKTVVLKGLETSAADVGPGHYTISDGLSKTKGWPINDTETLIATLLVIGNLNNPSTMQGYRVYLLFTNKKQFFVLTQWWSKEDVKTDNWRKVTLDTIS